MGCARRGRDGVRGPAGRPGRHEVDADPDPACSRRARAGNAGPRGAVLAVFAETGRYQSAGLGRRDGTAGGVRSLRAVRAQAAGGGLTSGFFWMKMALFALTYESGVGLK